jgi:hypothetical protein
MNDVWLVHPGGMIHFENSALYAEAKNRVLHSRRLRDYLDIIMGDGYADDQKHLLWVAKGKVSEIESWAKQIRNDSEVGS